MVEIDTRAHAYITEVATLRTQIPRARLRLDRGGRAAASPWEVRGGASPLEAASVRVCNSAYDSRESERSFRVSAG